MYKMAKFTVLVFFVICCLQALLVNAYTDNDLDATDRECLQEQKLDKNVVINSYDENDFIKEGNAQMNSFYECAWKKDRLLNDDGSINVANLKKMAELKMQKLFPDNADYRAYLATESVKQCKDVRGRNNGDTAVKIYNCLLTKIGEISERTKPEDIPK